jgi:hypothetical protein
MRSSRDVHSFPRAVLETASRATPMSTPVPRSVTVVGMIWFVVALALGASGATRGWRPPLPQAVLLGLTASLLFAFQRVATFRAWLMAVDVRLLVALHLIRLIAGGAFLVLYGERQLPWAFAVPGGVGDMIVAVLALFLVAAVPPIGERARRAYLLWNVVGFVDILFVVATAARLGLQEPASMQALLRLPLSLLPTFIVPLIIASHVVLFARLTSARFDRGRRR